MNQRPNKDRAGFATFRRGVVSAQDTTLGRVRVQFSDIDNLTSYWLAVPQRRALAAGDNSWDLPDIGSQVACLLDENFEDGCVLGCDFSNVDTPPVSSADKVHRSFKDSASIEYDRAAHAMTISLPTGATLSVTVNGATLTVDSTGNWNMKPKSGQLINLAGAAALIALVGGQVQVPNVQSGSDTVIGTIIPTANSTEVKSS